MSEKGVAQREAGVGLGRYVLGEGEYFTPAQQETITLLLDETLEAGECTNL